MKPSAKEPSLDIANTVHVELCSRERFMELGEKHRNKEIYMTGMTRGNLNSAKVTEPRHLWRVVYEVLKVACSAPPMIQKPEVFVQAELI